MSRRPVRYLTRADIRRMRKELFINPTLIVIDIVLWMWALDLIMLETMLVGVTAAVAIWWGYCRLFVRWRAPWRKR